MATKPMFLVYEGKELKEYVPPAPSKNVIVHLNNQWVADGTVDGKTLFKSNSSYHVSNGLSRCTIEFTGFDTFYIKARSNGESSYDYVEVGKLDATNISRTTESTATTNWYTFKNKASATTYTSIYYYSLGGNTHSIEIIYSKDGSANSNEDRGFFYIPEGEVTYVN